MKPHNQIVINDKSNHSSKEELRSFQDLDDKLCKDRIAKMTHAPKVPKFCILSIDGGGVRGIIPAVILKYIEEKTGRRISELFNLISGTSTGALLGLLMSIPKKHGEKLSTNPMYTANDGVDLYLKECSFIFKKSLLSDLFCIKGLRRARYNSKLKRSILSKYAQDFKINDLITDILVPAFDVWYRYINQAKGNLFSSRVFIPNATSSAPTYFKPTKVIEKSKNSTLSHRSFVDGALVANSPALCALSEACKNYGTSPENTILVSLGCGESKTKNDHDIVKKWGGLKWARYFPLSLISGSMYTVDFQILQVLRPRESYWRFQLTELPAERADIDNASVENLEWLHKEANKFIQKNKKSLDELCEILLENF